DGSLSPTELWLQADLSGVFGPFSIDDAALFLTGGSLDAFGVWLALESFFTSVNYPFVNFVGPVGYAANGGFPAGVIDFALLDSFPVGGFPLPPDAELLSVSDFEVRGGLSIEFKPVAVPEPSTYGLIGAGILGCLIAFRRYRINRINTAENLD
ncbi:MAG: PEP-CTERM sorting domain-containing protein, partial [Verrucomicrobiota bacterium]